MPVATAIPARWILATTDCVLFFPSYALRAWHGCCWTSSADRTQAATTTRKGEKMLGIWRFYKEGDSGWKWQRLSVNKVVMAESRATFAEYADCVNDATQRGYQPQPSQEKLRATFAPRSYNRSYTGLVQDGTRLQSGADGREQRSRSF